MNDALTDLVRDMNKFRGQVEKKNLDEDIRRKICFCSLEKRETSRAKQMRK